MRKYRIFLLFPLLLLSLIFVKRGFSQEASNNSFESDYLNYIHTLDLYRDANSQYKLKRAQYLKFKTLKSKEEARTATIKMLEERDEAVKTYLTALRSKSAETEGVPGADRETIFAKIDSEVKWFDEHKIKVGSSATLDDLVADSNEALERFRALEPFLYETLATISVAKVKNTRKIQSRVLTSIRDKLLEIKEEERPEFQFSDRKIQIMERWILEVENRLRRSEEKEVEAESFISELKKATKANISVYNRTQERVSESLQYLKEANPYLKEIINEVKTKE